MVQFQEWGAFSSPGGELFIGFKAAVVDYIAPVNNVRYYFGEHNLECPHNILFVFSIINFKCSSDYTKVPIY